VDFQKMIAKGLSKIGNYHPQVVVFELAEIFPNLICDITQKKHSRCYTCILEVRTNGSGKKLIN
jgi:hypothetical protein